MRLEVQSSMPTMLPEVSFPLCSNYGENGSRYHTVVECQKLDEMSVELQQSRMLKELYTPCMKWNFAIAIIN